MARVFVKDLRKLRYCVKGSKAFFDRYGLDWQSFKRNGIDAEKLRATGDGMAIKLVEAVENGKQ